MVVLMLLLCGCRAEDMETVMDSFDIPVLAPAGQLVLSLPEEASVPTMESVEGGKLYLCDGYTLTVQTFSSGDLSNTLRQTTGFTSDQITMIQTQQNGVRRYACVWSAAGEGGDQVGRAVILDDGNYHYAVCVMADFEAAGNLTDTWQELLDSVKLRTD